MKTRNPIIGPRILLESLKPQDITQNYANWMNDDEVVQYTESRGKNYTLKDLKNYIHEKNESPHDYLLGVFLKENREHIGNIKIGGIDLNKRSADIGVMIGNKKVWGQGFATEAIQLVTQYAFENLNLEKLIAGMLENNIGSLKAFLKSGYRQVDRQKTEKSFNGKNVDCLWMEHSPTNDKEKKETRKKINAGALLWEKAKQIIPGGNQLLSKRSEMFLPAHWPAYYKKAKGVEVWDLDDNRYIDMSIMAIGACVLGYANTQVDEAVKKAIDQGSITTLNCYEEFELAEKLVELHPWAQMVRFARTGGEANAIAVRIARAFSKKDKVAFCGYHGWSDWYLAANLANSKNLDGQLLPGLSAVGVPRELKGTSIPFHYGDVKELQSIVSKNKNKIGVIIMEVAKYKSVDVPFLKKVREMACEIKAVLIFDEVSSGFRVTTGGMHLLYDVEPDILVLGKALGNGYPISAIVGRRDCMQAAQQTFISSTFWTERIGFVAALATIKQFEEKKVAPYLVQMGSYLRRGLEKIFTDKKLNIEMTGLPSVPIMNIKEKDPLVIKTLFTQEMLKRGYLALNIIYVSLAHTKDIVDQYLEEADSVFAGIAKAKKSHKLKDLLEGPVCHSGFSRLN